LGNGLGIEEVIGPKKRALLTSARRLGAVRVRVFGSVRRREARPDSDVDLLVDWGVRRRPLAPLHLAIEARRLLGRRVDVASEETLSWSMRPYVLAEAVELEPG
ncbi:MAG TPA: nucleotidyltransferase domain-containing protein, partial [Thermoplasmata archaeon]|nr:nucleotidyltransferase domain-containing protein [Thermoplasmata archaeon]